MPDTVASFFIFKLKTAILMIKPEMHPREAERLKELEEFSILDTMPEVEYDDITELASFICGTPISLVNLIDSNRQWFKSHFGIPFTEAPRELGMCSHAINHPGSIFIVPDARLDERFHDNPNVLANPPILFYAGVPLVTASGLPMGTLCVIDHEPRVISEQNVRALIILAKQVVKLFELRKNKKALDLTIDDLEERNSELEKFAFVAAHDIKSPLGSMSALSQMLLEEYSERVDNDAKEMLQAIRWSADKLRSLVDGILEHSRSQGFAKMSKENLNLDHFLKETLALIPAVKETDLILPKAGKEIVVNRTGLQQVLLNLISNGIKYNDSDRVQMEIGFSESERFYHFFVSDNGRGISHQFKDKIFEIFTVLSTRDRYGGRGNGIGLATVKKLVEGMGGVITVDSEPGRGTRFDFTVSK